MTHVRRTLVAAAAAACLGPLAVAPAAAQQVLKLTVTAGHPPAFLWVKTLDEVFIPEVDKRLAGTPHKIEWTRAYGGTLTKLGSESKGVADGVADIGLISTVFEAPRFPLQNVTYVTPFVHRRHRARQPHGRRAAERDPRHGRGLDQGRPALLNGKTHFLRGSNFTLYRFFEDDACGDLPWRPDWVRLLHQRVKEMHWNCLRYCIGFPPEAWYDIADEVGLLIQDEFPIWTLDQDSEKEKLVAERLIREYTAWMRERWNHPCVVIWDAQNESSIEATGQAIRAVRSLDLSNRPWENGWAEPQSATDCVEAHPYLMSGLLNPAWGDSQFTSMKDMVRVSGIPSLFYTSEIYCLIHPDGEQIELAHL